MYVSVHVIWISALEGGKLSVTLGDVYYIWYLDDPQVWRGKWTSLCMWANT